MNKLKLMYDVLKAMKEKDVINGILKVKGEKDQTKSFNLVKEFEKNLLTGEVKVKISTEFNSEAKQLKHESNTEFNIQEIHGDKSFKKCMHGHHSHGGFKGKLNKIIFMLGIIRKLKINEQEGETILLTLDTNEIPEELKEIIHKKANHKMKHKHHGKHEMMREFFDMKDPNIEVKILINKEKEVEKITVFLDEKQEDQLDETHEPNLNIELCLS